MKNILHKDKLLKKIIPIYKNSLGEGDFMLAL